MPLDVSGTDGLLALVALAAGTVDAIGGGGGLLTLPALLAAGLPPHLALGTNKGQSVFGAAAALVRFSHAGLVPLARARWTFPLGFLGSLLGASLVLWVRPDVLRPVVLVLVVAAAAFVVLRPPLGGTRPASAAIAPAAALAFGVGAYDGFFGPGTGTLLIVGLAGLLALPLQQASAEAKAINFASNLAAAFLFAVRGTVVWHTALPMAAGQLVGGWLGAHLTIRGGERVVRWVVLAVVTALVVRLSFDALRR
ncbi:MAG TPA: TSUP family transporter [Myxococcaceae bacterium]|nr:TSUP family transporter [Myxococcaceae bacterium]